MKLVEQGALAAPASRLNPSTDQPLVSIISFCKDRASTIRRSIESVLNQSYRNIEFVVQDGASTDGTLEILRGYDDPRIKIVSEKDSGPAEAFWKVMNRCEGEFIGTCLSDEELLPDAVERAVGHFKANPSVGAITCDGYVTDTKGKIVNEFNAGEFNLVDYLFGWYCPFWPGSFFRRQALIDVGLKDGKWTIECLEFETWIRLGTRHEVKYIPERMSKYAVHATQLSNTRQYFHEHFDNRAKLIREIFSSKGFFGADEVKLNGCLYNQMYLLYNHIRAYKLADQEKLIAERMYELRARIPLSELIHYLNEFNFVAGTLTFKHMTLATALVKMQAQKQTQAYIRANAIWVRVALTIPASVRRKLPKTLKRGLRAAVFAALLFAFNTRYAGKNAVMFLVHKLLGAGPGELFAPEFSPRIYHHAAQIYYARGQIDQALQMWRKAEALEDSMVDGVACQAMLMSPRATYECLREAQDRWAARHARPIPELGACPVNAYHGDRKIRVGYFCGFFDSDTFRNIMGEVIRLADRDRFVLIAYSAERPSRQVQALFDEFKVCGIMPDPEFVRMVRNDQIDICVELSGLSPFNRFSAMASRCAPIQISYLNHSGTCGVPNVDYVLADGISVPPEHDSFYTEKVWRLPGSFLCYNYDRAEAPAISAPPSPSRGYITFGYFGSGGKVGLELIELWSQILHRVSGSRLFIRNYQLSTVDNREFMINRFRRFDIESDRLIIMGGADRQTVLKCMDEIDISLDTWPYCGGNTVAESLWQGVPVITLMTDRFSGRYGASLLMAAGCEELVADSPEEYVNIACALADSPERLRHYRGNLRAMMKEHGLSDAAAFAKKLDAAYIAMMQRLHRDRPTGTGQGERQSDIPIKVHSE